METASVSKRLAQYEDALALSKLRFKPFLHHLYMASQMAVVDGKLESELDFPRHFRAFCDSLDYSVWPTGQAVASLPIAMTNEISGDLAPIFKYSYLSDVINRNLEPLCGNREQHARAGGVFNDSRVVYIDFCLVRREKP